MREGRRTVNLLPLETKLPHHFTSTPPFGNYRGKDRLGSIQKKKKNTHLKRKEDNHNRNNSPTIHRRTQHIIKLAPPSEVLLPNQILKDEPNKEPRTIVDACSRWDS